MAYSSGVRKTKVASKGVKKTKKRTTARGPTMKTLSLATILASMRKMPPRATGIRKKRKTTTKTGVKRTKSATVKRVVRKAPVRKRRVKSAPK